MPDHLTLLWVGAVVEIGALLFALSLCRAAADRKSAPRKPASPPRRRNGRPSIRHFLV